MPADTLLHERYRLIRVLGSGGFGQTYLAEDLGQTPTVTCVVKHFRPANTNEDFLLIARRLFSREAETLSKLGSHPQIPSLLDSFEEQQEFYLVQEYIEGPLLSEVLQRERQLSEAAVERLLREVLQVLDFVHRHQVIHRDIKPSNLIQRRADGRMVVIDFGAVKELQTQITTLPATTNYTVGIGTQGYGPSEQMMGKPRFSSDVYALGMTAIQALTGLQPSQLPTHPETDEIIWQDHAQGVSPKLVAILTKMTRYHFSQRYQSAQAVLEALDLPAAVVIDETQMPQTQLDRAIDTTPQDALPASDRAHLRAGASSRVPQRKFSALIAGVVSVGVTGLVLGLKHLGWLQPLELAAYDRMVQVSPAQPLDERLLIVGITEQDIQRQGRFPIPDQTIAQVLQKLQVHQPRAIGMDLLRDIEQPPGRPQLLEQLQQPNTITIFNLGNPITPPPPTVPPARAGFNDIPLDPGDIVRRALLSVRLDPGFIEQYNLPPTAQGDGLYESFALRLAKTYLAVDNIQPQANPDTGYVQLGKAVFQPLQANSGGYQDIDHVGYQMLLRYRDRSVARQVSLFDVLDGKVDPDWVRDRVVLIGTTAPSGKDLFSTPFSTSDDDAVSRMPGVVVHGQIVSQVLRAAIDGYPLPWFWSEWGEAFWILGWAVIGGGLAWVIRHPVGLGLGGVLVISTLGGVSFVIFLNQGWVPVVAPAMAAMLAGGLVVVCQAYWLPHARTILLPSRST